MYREFRYLLSKCFGPVGTEDVLPLYDPEIHFDVGRQDEPGIARAMNAAFLIALCGKDHPAHTKAESYLVERGGSTEWGAIAGFFRQGVDRIRHEIETEAKRNNGFSKRLRNLREWISGPTETRDPLQTAEKIWSVFFPEGVGINIDRTARLNALRTKRTVSIDRAADSHISDPGSEILFTSNVLLSVPRPDTNPLELSLSRTLKKALPAVQREPQLFWYDHPIPMGIDPGANEILYGLRGLRDALNFERGRGNAEPHQKLKCILSASVTHRGLHPVAGTYIQQVLRPTGVLNDIDLYVFTEADAEKLRREVLTPAAERYLGAKHAETQLRIFGVDGEYGRHYSFLKAIAPFWKLMIDPEVRATFKIDLDQIFPQNELVQQTGASAFEHLKTPLWGAQGRDCAGHPLELGMIAGALVNERDIEGSLFCPDVGYPDLPGSPDEYFFYSALTQALSTEGEMGTRYGQGGIDGQKTCIQRFHVTGGTNGILIDALRRYRPFTPSFIGRAEDQAYILSVLTKPGRRLAYVHKDGLIMRHDKEAFAQEAVKEAFVPKLVGDLVRILYFSAYAQALTGNVSDLKNTLAPFTGCFISRIPSTLAYLRLSLKAASLFALGNEAQGLELIRNGAQRLGEAFGFVEGKKSRLMATLAKERSGWDLYYDTIEALEEALAERDAFALELKERAVKIVEKCAAHR